MGEERPAAERTLCAHLSVLSVLATSCSERKAEQPQARGAAANMRTEPLASASAPPSSPDAEQIRTPGKKAELRTNLLST